MSCLPATLQLFLLFFLFIFCITLIVFVLFVLCDIIHIILTLLCVTIYVHYTSIHIQNDPTIPRAMLACYIMTIIFMIPYIIAVFLYLMDISYLSGEIDLRGDISEPEVPEGTTDLSNVSLRDLCGACLAAPCLICLQLSALLECCKCICHLCKTDDRAKRRRKRKRENERHEQKEGGGFFENLFSMIRSVSQS